MIAQGIATQRRISPMAEGHAALAQSASCAAMGVLYQCVKGKVMGIGFDKSRVSALVKILAPQRLTRVVDVGANPLSPPPYAPLLATGLCEVWGFEPQPEAFAQLVAEAGPHEHYLPHAVGSGKTAELRICVSSGLTSTLEPNRDTFDALQRFHESGRVVERIKLKTRKLDDMDELPDFDLLKIDIQGGEVEVFKGGKKKLAKALCVITEAAAVPLYVDQPLLDKQMTTLAPLGYVLHKLLTTKSFSFRGPFAERMHMRKFRSQFVDGDVVFVRDVLSLSHIDDEGLKHLAILADAVFDSQDVAVAAMAQLEARGVLPASAIHDYLDMLPFVSPREAG